MRIWDVHRNFENFKHIPGNLEGNAFKCVLLHAQHCVCVVFRNEPGAYASLPLSTLEVLIKKEVKAKAWLKTAWQSVKSLAQQVHRSPHKDWETYWFQAHRKPLSNHYLTTTKQRVQWTKDADLKEFRKIT